MDQHHHNQHQQQQQQQQQQQHHHSQHLHNSLPPQDAPLHWGYAAAPTWTPVQTRAPKRPLSESDDCDDVFSEESSKEQCTSPGDPDSCQMLSRKKRRGVIEKKRRDRINLSLTELKRLVPSAFEKQGSAKLEKAEILQMTVDHLKMIHAKGLDTFAYDPHKYAMDYHGMGFRECVAEVARYLERIEGLDVQNPLRLRLTSHLQCCAAQRELATKQAPPPPTPWGYHAPPPPPPPPSSATSAPGLSQPYGVHAPPPPLPVPAAPSTVTTSSTNHQHHNQTQTHHHHLQHQHQQQHQQQQEHLYSDGSASTSQADNRLAPPPPPAVATTVLTPLTTSTAASATLAAYQYGNNNNNATAAAFSVPTSSHHNNYNQNNIATPQGMKPYRPWGAEVAY